MKLRCLIADDEPLARAGIKHLLSSQPQFEVIADTGNGQDALRLARLHQPDIIFLDIQMPGLDGLSVLKQLASKPAVIFCSAYAEHAVTAFELSAADYLLKPYSAERFQQALFKACGKIINHLSAPVSSTAYADRLTIRDPGRLRIVDVSDISWIGSAGNYVDIHLYSQSKSLLLRDTMTAIEKKLDPAQFARIHRSAIVRKSDIVELRPGDKGDAEVILKNGASLTLSRRHRAALAELFGQLN
ncbi:LytR/AlgR family response regulator transcription factor [Rheinheimera nanhaiensis]|uniref:Two-component system, LytT family, response regulator LytT n=1 Tax=Rheinheimera nanhaiensis E407-8 TaxID=562729 RepID=I1E0S7_9GAMM|nr:LytTR family DNA-binding domain-containing protein [Rheinheimera nanhaiensis]GAB59905.1 two-component system, LytT family, response regulator LytT [Rheinheimera nanhaiensis E407-8]